MFLPLGVEPFQPPVFTGSQWNLVPPGLRKVPKPHRDHQDGGPGPLPPGPFPFPGGPPSGGGNTQAVNATAAGAAAGGVFATLPGAFSRVRRRPRKRGRGDRAQFPGRG
jgi:hypothetical protein